MSYSAERIAIETRFANAWGTTTPIAYENVPFTPPAETYVRLTILTGEERQASMGDAPLYRHAGVIDVGIFAPIGSAAKSVAILADTIAEIFRGMQFAGITCRAPSVRSLGVQEGRYQVNVSVPFQRDETF